MLDTRLNNLAIISIEKDLSSSISTSTILDKFMDVDKNICVILY